MASRRRLTADEDQGQADEAAGHRSDRQWLQGFWRRQWRRLPRTVREARDLIARVRDTAVAFVVLHVFAGEERRGMFSEELIAAAKLAGLLVLVFDIDIVRDTALKDQLPPLDDDGGVDDDEKWEVRATGAVEVRRKPAEPEVGRKRRRGSD